MSYIFASKHDFIFSGRPTGPLPSILRPTGRNSYYDDQDFDDLSPCSTAVLTPSEGSKPPALLPQVLYDGKIMITPINHTYIEMDIKCEYMNIDKNF